MWYVENRNPTTFNISWICNQECIFCSWYPKQPLDLEKDILQKIKWLKEISLQWWEPTLSPNLFEIIKFARNNWTNFINLITNWIRISDEKFVNEIAWNVDCYQFAFPSHLKDKADYLSWRKDVLKLKSKALLNLIKLWEADKIRIVHLIQNENIVDLPNFPYFIKKYFLEIKLIEYKYIQYFDNKNNIWKIPKYSENKELFNKAFLITLALWINIIINWIPLCFLLKKLHKYTSYYNNLINDNYIEDYWTQKLIKCRQCEFSNKCIWVRKDYLMFYGDEEFR
jgi:MoaA/NifB/PqqE/SkfB family radical SAM enzyme